MKKRKQRKNEELFKAIISFNTFLATITLCFVIFFILKESIPIFKAVSVKDFITGTKWNPLSNRADFSILPAILGSLYTSFIAILISVPLGIGAAIFICFYTSERFREAIKSIVQIIMGVPSVIFGFIGLMVLVSFFEKNLNMAAGECVLAGGIVLGIMTIPCVISTVVETMDKVREGYSISSTVLGVSKSYMIKNLVLPVSKHGIFSGIILAFSRAIGETMAVMLVIGNSAILPKLFGRAQTIPALIALEMGSAEIGSMHYHALFASGLVLLVILLIINLIFYYFKSKWDY
ncbi:phosphate ABC transporter membrane protein 1, PhoT family [Clostridium collagenovorans DSM 3089]|uniref:Phosphate transport system permease protein n=1 Tax=Clostridium collagenovorans DSM 3089 TaxID=1121306 RepID=A0A1M5XVA8_9CLOT|nr:phosphate ABC transporter permease subunit PstC [Clostridium collagenovorans]SHI03740.1 phosphate ABC transporter membrane protein 1, PhoT family [Clostridium collagenovorans DSM 3089]